MNEFYIDKIIIRYKWSIFIKFLPILLMFLAEWFNIISLDFIGYVFAFFCILLLFGYSIGIPIIMTAVFTIQYITALVKYKSYLDKEDIKAALILCIIDIVLLIPCTALYFGLFMLASTNSI